MAKAKTKRAAQAAPTTRGKRKMASAPVHPDDSKAVEKAEAEKAMPNLAREINVRLEKAQKLDQQGDDHRLTAALRLGEAKKNCKLMGVKFEDWCGVNIKFSFSTCRELAAIGLTDHPKQAIEDLRAVQRDRQVKSREKKKNVTSRQGGTRASKPASDFQVAEEALDRMGDVSMKLIESHAKKHGLAVVSATAAKQQVSGADGIDAAKFAFEALTATQKMAFLEWACGETGMTLVNPYADEMSDGGKNELPEFLKRNMGNGEATAGSPSRRRRGQGAQTASGSSS